MLKIAWETAFTALLRPESSIPPKFSDVIKHLAAFTPKQLAAIGEIQISAPSRRELLIINLLKQRHPTLRIRITQPCTAPEACCGTEDERTEFVAPAEQLRVAAEIIALRGIEEEGIFRLMKNLSRVEELRAAIASGQRINMLGDSPFDLASLLKAYTRVNVPNLLDAEKIEQIVAANDATLYLSTLDPETREYVGFLGRVARNVASHQEKNRMDMSNLARVFAPNFFQHPDPLVEMKYIKATIEATKIILQSA